MGGENMKYIIPAQEVLDDFIQQGEFICWSVAALVVKEMNKTNPDIMEPIMDDVSDPYFKLVYGFGIDLTKIVLTQLFKVLDGPTVNPAFLEHALATDPQDVLEVLAEYQAAWYNAGVPNNKPINLLRTTEFLFGMEHFSVNNLTVGLITRIELLQRMISRGIDFEIEIENP